MPGYLLLFRKNEDDGAQSFLMPRSACRRLAYRLAAVPRRMLVPVWRTMMKGRAMRTVVFFAMVGLAFMAGGPDSDISGMAERTVSQVSSVSGVVWGFLVSREETGWMCLAQLYSWLALIIGLIWGIIGAVGVHFKDPIPSLVVHIWKASDSSLPIWAIVCILFLAPVEGGARLVSGLITFDLKRLLVWRLGIIRRPVSTSTRRGLEKGQEDW